MMKINKIILILMFVVMVSAMTPQPGLTQSHAQNSPERSWGTAISAETQPITTAGPPPVFTPAPPSNSQSTDQHQTAPQARLSAVGPDQFPQGVNPLTGQTVADPELLNLPPALISVSNFPVSARPQAGLSFAPYVYEMFIGEGMTRFLAIFYGEYPKVAPAADGTVATNDQAEIGPVRSGRLPYQAIRQLYNGFLVMSSASAEVRSTTGNTTNIYGSDSEDINSAKIDVADLQALAESNANAQITNLSGNLYDPKAPQGGKAAEKLWVFYNFYNQAQWTYDQANGNYLRFQDQADGSGKFYPATDRLTGEQLASENVIMMFVEHEVLNSTGTLIDFNLLYTQGNAYLLRDGKVYPIYWSTIGGDYEKSTGRFRPIRFTDTQGNPIALKPGHTWVEVMDLSATFSETQPGSWKARFYAP
jgi:hypothetical protein